MTDLRVGTRPAGVPARDTLSELKPIQSRFPTPKPMPTEPVGKAHERLAPAPALKRPVVMVPGLMLGASSYENMASHFASNPQNRQAVVYNAKSGTFHAGSANGRPLTDAQVRESKIFVMEPRNRFGAPSDAKQDVSEMLSAVKRATGQSSIDAVTHSAGGHHLRSYLDTRTDKGVKLNNVVMVGPVSHGTVMGSIGAGWAPLAGKAAEEMKIGGSYTERLNARFDTQREQMKSLTVIATNGAATFGPGGSDVDGDGFVEPRQAELPGATNILLSTSREGWFRDGPSLKDRTPKNHFDQIEYSGVINHVGAALVR